MNSIKLSFTCVAHSQQKNIFEGSFCPIHEYETNIVQSPRLILY